MKPVFLAIDRQFYLSKITSLALKDALEKWTIKAKIKWPNDIYVSDHKIAGILIENSLLNGKIGVSIIGIGLNVDQKQFPEEINATSISLETGSSVDKKEFLSDFCSFFEAYYLELKTGKTENINKKYMSYLMNFGVNANYKNKEKEFKGRITNVLEDGKIEILNLDEDISGCYEMKEISLLT